MKRKPQKYHLQARCCKNVMALLCILTLMGTSGLVRAANVNDNNVHLYGALVAEPCVVRPGDEDIRLDFGTIIDKYLYLNIRTPAQPFEIHLEECDVSLGNTITVTFRGTGNTELPGLLAIDGGSSATGIAIGLETAEAKPLALNSASGRFRLQGGSNIIGLKAYVQGEPEAIASKTVGRGAFSAVATFVLEYE